MNKISLISVITLLSIWTACNLEKEIDLNLPAYESQPVVECYLEPGKPFDLLLTNSAAYFDVFPTENLQFLENILESEAIVTITHKDNQYTLNNQLSFNPLTNKVFNYHSEQLVPEDFENDFELNITTKDGKNIRATTRILPEIPIDSVVVEFAETDTLARLITYFTDDPSTADHYRRMLHFSSLDSIPRQDFFTDDSFVDNDVVAFGSLYDFAEGDTVFNTLHHIDKAYFDYLNSTSNAVQSNGNPFGQPGVILSNLEGDPAIGIFTGLSYDRIRTIVKK